jgi:protein arginine N-methyltransferase 2
MSALKRALPVEDIGATDVCNADSSAGAVLLAHCEAGDLEAARALLVAEAANDDGDDSADAATFQDDGSGTSCLMAAAAKGSLALVQLLLQHGAPWNALDRTGRCAGEYAVAGIGDCTPSSSSSSSSSSSMGEHQACVDCLVQAGVAAELLFGAVDRRERLASVATSAAVDAALGAAAVSGASSSSSSSSGGGGGASDSGGGGGGGGARYDAHFPAAPGQYLEDRGVRYDGDNLLDSADDAVMMAWEAPLMEAHADVLCATSLDAFGR